MEDMFPLCSFWYLIFELKQTLVTYASVIE